MRYLNFLPFIALILIVAFCSYGCGGSTEAETGCKSHSECAADELCNAGTCEPFESLCPDADRDGICDDSDRCAEGDDGRDQDRDGIPDDCDVCPKDELNDSDSDSVCDSGDICLAGDDSLDSDEDGVPDACDACPGSDDSVDTDNDGRPDPCDACPDDPTPDSDGDGVCDSEDVCDGFDDTQNADGDSLPDGCDPCPQDSAGDSDGDGVCDTEDLCPGSDDGIDGDFDSLPDACDPCPQDNPNDSDGDGICDSFDLCPGFPDGNDADGDTVPDDCDRCQGGDDRIDPDSDSLLDTCDPCPNDPYNDSDNDGICYYNDICPVGDDSIDGDGDLTPDACDPCPNDNPDDSDFDGICESSDTCAGDNASGDSDGDSICNDIDLDDDNDGCGDEVDANSTVASVDTDGDSKADDCDPCPNHNPDNIDACDVCNGPGVLTWYGDNDGDGTGDPLVVATACEQPQGFVANNQDPCPNHNPDALDACNVCGGPGKFTYYADTDNDQLGDLNAPLEACTLPGGYVTNFSDACPEDPDNDADGDNVCGNVDPCPSHNPDGDACGVCNFVNDTDRDSVCNAQDICEGFDDSQDADNDGKPDGCDDGFTLLFEDVEGNINWTTESIEIDTTAIELAVAGGALIPTPLSIQRRSFPEGSQNISFSFQYPPDEEIDGAGHLPGASEWKSPEVSLQKDGNENLPQRFVVRFSHYYDFDHGDCFSNSSFSKPEGGNADGGIVGVYDSGVWQEQTPYGGYPQTTYDIWDAAGIVSPPENICQPNGVVGVFGLPDENANQSQFVESVIDLSHFATRDIHLGFRAIWDCVNCAWYENHPASSEPEPVGWYIDDIEVLRTRCGDAKLEAGEYCDNDTNCSDDCTYTPLLPWRGSGSADYLDNICPVGNVAVGFDASQSEGMCMICRDFDGVSLGDETLVNFKGQACALSATSKRCDLDAGGNVTTDGVLVGLRTSLNTNGSIQSSAALCQTAEKAVVSSPDYDVVGNVQGAFVDDRCVGGTIVRGFNFYAGSSDGFQFHCAPSCAAGQADVCGVCDGPGLLAWYRDGDGDGKGDPNDSNTACTAASGFVSDNTDLCPLDPNDDSDGDGTCDSDDPCPDDNPNEIDVCGECDGPGELTWYKDDDDDDLGDLNDTTSACSRPAGYVANSDDDEPNCATNDTDDCGDCGGSGPATWWRDTDGDGKGVNTLTTTSCTQPAGYADPEDGEDPCPSNNPDNFACGGCNYGADNDQDGSCDWADSDDDNDGCPDTQDPSRTVATTYTWNSHINGTSGVLSSCSGCHSGEWASAGMDVTSKTSVKSNSAGDSECAGQDRVVSFTNSGTPETSLLYKKLTDPTVCGATMPYDCAHGSGCWPDTNATNLKKLYCWIKQGAK